MTGVAAELGRVSTVTGAALPLLVLIWLSWIARQAITFRTASGERRAQLKWLISGAAACVIGPLVLIFIGTDSSPVANAILRIAMITLAALPLSIGVGILKYRLYDIDRLISRTLSYAIVTSTLAAVFVVLVLLTSDVLPFSSPVGVAASTLAAAALFNPLRLRVQRLVDRRFNRAHYDAEATVAAFTMRLRDAVDLDTVRRELLLGGRPRRRACARLGLDQTARLRPGLRRPHNPNIRGRLSYTDGTKPSRPGPTLS